MQDKTYKPEKIIVTLDGVELKGIEIDIENHVKMNNYIVDALINPSTKQIQKQLVKNKPFFIFHIGKRNNRIDVDKFNSSKITTFYIDKGLSDTAFAVILGFIRHSEKIYDFNIIKSS